MGAVTAICWYAQLAWHWHIRVPLCCMGVLSCGNHSQPDEIDATWLTIDWSAPLTPPVDLTDRGGWLIPGVNLLR